MNNTKYVEALYANLSSAHYYPLKKSFGTTLDLCNIDAVLAYTLLSRGAEASKEEQNIEFLVAGLCYNTLRPNKNYSSYRRVSFEEVLRRMRKDVATKSTDNLILNFLKLRMDTNGYFNKRFRTLTSRMSKYIYPGEVYDFGQLLYDLKCWSIDNRTQIKWAKSLIDIKED